MNRFVLRGFFLALPHHPRFPYFVRLLLETADGYYYFDNLTLEINNRPAYAHWITL